MRQASGKAIFRATSCDVAEKAGVSQSMVSRALSGSSCAARATGKRIEAIARDLAYQVDPMASPVRRMLAAREGWPVGSSRVGMKLVIRERSRFLPI
ncbi:LacI family DNA-binding transcriptional regulator [Novosphingobium sp.]|uniref:helix-turn-helix domain-containing protein n=1 Tax=Novosphingobium sp. TaxID=1874826 RepID=UPI0031D62971